MRRSFHLGVCLLQLLLASIAWSQKSAYDPAAKAQDKPRDGFVNFALQQINPENKDYGRQIDEARKFVVAKTIKSVASWAVLVALGFLLLSFVMLLHQHRERDRREMIAADFLAQYHNAWVGARAQASEATERYNQLVQSTNRAEQAAARLSPAEAQGGVAGGAVGAPDTDRKPKAAHTTVTQTAPQSGATAAQPDKATVPKRAPDMDLMAQISTLQQQLNASHERERNLQTELGKAQRRAASTQPKDSDLRS